MVEVTDVVSLMNAVREECSADYKTRVPQVTRDNLPTVLKNVFNDIATSNEFFINFVNKVAVTMVKVSMFKNPFRAVFGGQKVPNLGNGVEELYVNPSDDVGFDTDGTKLLKQYLPDGKVAYYVKNRRGRIPVTINRAQIMGCANSEENVMSLCNAILTAMYSGDEIAEFEMCLKLCAEAVQGGYMTTLAVGDIETSGVPKKLAKSMQNVHDLMCFPSGKYNMYNNAHEKEIEAGEKECVTWSPIDERILLIRSDVKNEVNYEVLASLFNMSVVELKARTMFVPCFPTEDSTYIGEDGEKYKRSAMDVYAILCDKSTLNIKDTLYTVDKFENAMTMSLNTYLHHWEYIYLSSFSNCVAFVKEVPSDTKVETEAENNEGNE